MLSSLPEGAGGPIRSGRVGRYDAPVAQTRSRLLRSIDRCLRHRRYRFVGRPTAAFRLRQGRDKEGH